MLDLKQIMEQADILYEESAGAPIRSRQIRALAEALVDQINNELAILKANQTSEGLRT